MPPLAGWTLWITGFVGKVPAIDNVMSLLVSDFFIPVLICLILLLLWAWSPDRTKREHNQKTVMNAAVAIGISTLAIRVINMHDFWPRPFSNQLPNTAIYEAASRAADMVFYQTHDPSFPSNAAAVAFAAATAVWLSNRKAGAILYVLAILWAFARFYAGIHFFVDLATGAFIGALTAYMLCKYFMPRTEPLPTIALHIARALYIA